MLSLVVLFQTLNNKYLGLYVIITDSKVTNRN